jgi:hypothetical protein
VAVYESVTRKRPSWKISFDIQGLLFTTIPRVVVVGSGRVFGNAAVLESDPEALGSCEITTPGRFERSAS